MWNERDLFLKCPREVTFNQQKLWIFIGHKKNSVRKRLCWRYFPVKPWLQPYCIKIEPVTVGADATVYVWFLDQIYVDKAVQTALPPLQPWLAIGFSAAITDYFWDSVQISRTLKQAGTLQMPLWKLQIC